jgi:hypothetical protein
MTRISFVLTLSALVALTAEPVAAAYTRGGPAPLIGAGLPVIIVAGAALAGYRRWRRKGRPTDDS